MVQHTHDIELGDEHVVKVYRQWSRGEPDREWHALGLLDRYAPGLAPRPLERGQRGDHPYIVMTRVPGNPLGDGPLSTRQITAVATALQQLHRAVPEAALAELPERTRGPAAMLSRVRSWIDSHDGPILDSVEPTLAAACVGVR